MKTQIHWLTFSLSLFLFSIPCHSEELNTQEILAFSDRTRGGFKEGMEWNVKLYSVEDGETSEREFFVKSKLDNSYVESTSPQKFKGEVYIFNARTIWFYKTGLRKPIAISAKQKLSGVASNGDIASTNYVRDYSVTSHSSEKFNGEDCYLMHLKSKASDTTYDQIDYWISKKSKLGLKADFLSLSGKVMKTAVFKYDNKISYEGVNYPFVSEMKITDAKNSNLQSTLIYSPPHIKKHPDSLFNVNNLLR